ncbi:MAG: sugar isomerase, KpsF/GutQ family protein, partial [Micavibrio sp.]|nr:sugar isomerase, KpsF/GutQ family protein [Micavibrio sp.]
LRTNMNAKPIPLTTDSKQAGEDIAAARRVLATEIAGLNALVNSIDGSFSRAVDVIHSMKTGSSRGNRLIISGIGKSGHVARKLAATLASTGTPSYFVHANEASHGDLGMISEGDIVLLLSNSGENSELSDMIAYTRRFGITLIAMTSKADSALAQHADIVLLMPRMPEACPDVMAPTTSTTMMLALGDALAVTLLERMGLTSEQFKVFHPGGKLGQKLKKVSDVMHGYDKLPIVADTATMDQAILALSSKNLGSVLIESEPGVLAGIITDGDLKRHMAPDLMQKPVVAVMSKNAKTIDPDALAAEALELMTRTPGHYLTSLIVMRDGKIAGLIRVQDCLQAGVA